MSKVLIFLNSGQTIETYLNYDVVVEMAEVIKKHITNKDDNCVAFGVGSDKAPDLLVSTNNIVAIKVIWDVEE